MKNLVLIVTTILFIVCLANPVLTDERILSLMNEVKKIEGNIRQLAAEYESSVQALQKKQVQEQQPKVMLAGFGCTPEKPKEPPIEVVPIKPQAPTPPTGITVPEERSKSDKIPMVVKVAKGEDNTWKIKLNTKLKKGEEVHLCIGYMYFPSNQIGSDGTVKIKTGWTPPDNPRVSVGIWNGVGYISSALISG
jgi:hypothetical protein